MKKLLILFACISTITILVSCNGSQQEKNIAPKKSDTIKLISKDVNGYIIANGKFDIGDYTLNTTAGNPPTNVTYNGLTVELGDSATLKITPCTSGFSELKSELVKKMEFFGKYEIVESKDSSFLYHYVNVNADSSKEEGYNFLVIIKGKTRQYEITGEGKNPLLPIANKQFAEKTYKAALTFMPTE